MELSRIQKKVLIKTQQNSEKKPKKFADQPWFSNLCSNMGSSRDHLMLKNIVTHSPDVFPKLANGVLPFNNPNGEKPVFSIENLLEKASCSKSKNYGLKDFNFTRHEKGLVNLLDDSQFEKFKSQCDLPSTAYTSLGQKITGHKPSFTHQKKDFARPRDLNPNPLSKPKFPMHDAPLGNSFISNKYSIGSFRQASMPRYPESNKNIIIPSRKVPHYPTATNNSMLKYSSCLLKSDQPQTKLINLNSNSIISSGISSNYLVSSKIGNSQFRGKNYLKGQLN
jgi:hypothetical protein